MSCFTKLVLIKYGMSKRSNLQWQDLQVYARFCYSKDKPALRVHVWDIFDEAHLNTKDLNDFYDHIYNQLEDLFYEQDFESDVSEVDTPRESDKESSVVSMNDQLMDVVNKI